MRGGTLRHYVTFYRNVETDGDDGVPTRVESEVDNAWVSIEPLRGREAIEAQQLDATLTHKVRKRYNGDAAITPECWFEHNGRTFNVKSVRNIHERGAEEELMCGEDVG